MRSIKLTHRDKNMPVYVAPEDIVAITPHIFQAREEKEDGTQGDVISLFAGTIIVLQNKYELIVRETPRLVKKRIEDSEQQEKEARKTQKEERRKELKEAGFSEEEIQKDLRFY